MPRRLAVLVFCLAAAPAFALDYRSLSEPAIMYDAPATQARRLFVIARHTPVELVVSLNDWAKVRDRKGDLAWVEAKSLSAKRMVLVRVERASVFDQPSDKSARVFEAEADVVLELIETGPPGWARVRHRDGQSGYVRVSQVWGL